MKVCFPVARFGREVLKAAGYAAIFAVCINAFAEPPEQKIPFTPSKFPKIQVRHVPAPANDSARQIPAPGTPRTRLPVVAAPGPKGGKLIRPDNTYLIPCPVPPLAATSTNPPSTVTNAAPETK